MAPPFRFADTEQPDFVPPFMPLKSKRVVLAVTGSIAAYKSAALASLLIQSGATVHVILTSAAQKLISAATFAAITHHPVTTDLWNPNSELAMDHISLASKADILVVAPATANSIAKLALGIADDPLGATFLAHDLPTLVAPAMDVGMFESPTVTANVNALSARGVRFAGPITGRMASGAVGLGRMMEPTQIVQHVRAILGSAGLLRGKQVLVTAGGTREYLDPIRYIGNPASGKMGFALAEAARDMGAQVVLITGPTYLPSPELVTTIRITTAQEMYSQVISQATDADLLLAAAAVTDFRPKATDTTKVKRAAGTPTVEFVLNPDIAAAAKGARLVKIVFAAETDDNVAEAARKAQAKGAAFTVLNNVSNQFSGFNSDYNRATLVRATGAETKLELMSKATLAQRILEEVVNG